MGIGEEGGRRERRRVGKKNWKKGEGDEKELYHTRI